MKDETAKRLKNSDIWTRAVFMILFAIAYRLAELVMIGVVIFQFLATLITGAANEPVLRFGRNLGLYIREILEYQTFNAELRPFPFAPWPDEEPGGERWTNPEAFTPEIDSDRPSSSESDDLR